MEERRVAEVEAMGGARTEGEEREKVRKEEGRENERAFVQKFWRRRRGRTNDEEPQRRIGRGQVSMLDEPDEKRWNEAWEGEKEGEGREGTG